MLYTAITRAKFQSTLLQEERHYVIPIHYVISSFQSTLLQEERPIYRHSFYWWFEFQSTLLQEERLNNIFCPTCFRKISIHAPTRGATITCRSRKLITEIFQSTLLQEERPSSMKQGVSVTNISIHAPTRGATQWMGA